MIKFENVTVIFLKDGDFLTPELLNDYTQAEVDTADIVIDEGKVVKNRFGEVCHD
ncbi:hypothetical protein [Serratia sarumanii]|uniref:hypothetical protein n=1 Tax=Serratia sarumanii TaxID=3020826 RepID=UPI003F7EDB10